MNIDKPVILFDGVCNFCNGWVNFIINQDPQKIFLFCPLQSETGKNLLAKCKNYDEKKNSETVILVEKGTCYFKSDVAIMIGKNLSGIWFLISLLLRITPRFIRDFVYDIIAKNRYKWFGKKESCMIPTPDVMERF